MWKRLLNEAYFVPGRGLSHALDIINPKLLVVCHSGVELLLVLSKALDIGFNPFLNGCDQFGIPILIIIRDIQFFDPGQRQITKLIDDP
jgi:hypothetical protein